MYSSEILARTLQTMIKERSSSCAEFATDHIEVTLGAAHCIEHITKTNHNVSSIAQNIKYDYLENGIVPSTHTIFSLITSCDCYIQKNIEIQGSAISEYLSLQKNSRNSHEQESKFALWGCVEVIFRNSHATTDEYNLIACYVESFTPLPLPKKALNTLISFVNS